MNKELQRAIKEVLKARIDKENHGMMVTKKVSHQDLRLLFDNEIDIYHGYNSKGFNGKNNVIVQRDKIIAIIKPRYASKKVNGMYKELTPIIEWL